jgi:hypothetical protein
VRGRGSPVPGRLLISPSELHALLDVARGSEAAQREADIQMGEKLAAQMTLKAVCDALNLPMVSLGNGWTEATPKILARIEEIVDEGERGFRERDSLERAYRQACTNLATIRPDLTRDFSVGETADLYYDALLAGWGGIEGYDPGRHSEEPSDGRDLRGGRLL